MICVISLKMHPNLILSKYLKNLYSCTPKSIFSGIDYPPPSNMLERPPKKLQESKQET